VVGGSETLSLTEYVKKLQSFLGIELSKNLLSAEEALADDPTGLKREMWETFQYVTESGYTGGDPDVITADEVSIVHLEQLRQPSADKPQLEKKYGVRIPRTSIAEHMKRQDWSGLLNLPIEG
jgi:hypothetical protein